MNFVIIIPARFNSSRLSCKALIDINGKPMILHVMEKALMSKAKRVIVATDHVDIAKIVTQAGGEVCWTHNKHQSGTERLGEVISYYRFDDQQIIVNLQGDEPLISPEDIFQVVKDLNNNNTVTTLATPINSRKEIFDTNIVKVVTNILGHAMYFSRASIPWHHNFSLEKEIKENVKNYSLLRHIGIYAYRSNFIYRYLNWPTSSIEKIELLEQLRILWYGEKISVTITNKINNISVNTLDDVIQVRRVLQNKIE